MFWIKIDKFGEMPIESPFLLRDEGGCVYVGLTAFDYYDAEYWFPMPILPNPPIAIITNDAWVHLALREQQKRSSSI